MPYVNKSTKDDTSKSDESELEPRHGKENHDGKMTVVFKLSVDHKDKYHKIMEYYNFYTSNEIFGKLLDDEWNRIDTLVNYG